MTCALEANCVYDVRLVRVRDLLRTYSTTFACKWFMSSKRLVCTKYDCCEWATYFVRYSKRLILQILTVFFVQSNIVWWLVASTEGLLVRHSCDLWSCEWHDVIWTSSWLATVWVIWLACTKLGPYRTIWLACTDLGLYRTLWLDCTELGPYRTLWLACTELGPYRTIWLACRTRSV